MDDEPELAICAKLTESVVIGYYSDGYAMIGHDKNGNTVSDSRPATPMTKLANRDGPEAAAIIKGLVKAAERGLEAAIECANECKEKDGVFGNYMKDIHFIEAALSRAGANNDPSK